MLCCVVLCCGHPWRFTAPCITLHALRLIQRYLKSENSLKQGEWSCIVCLISFFIHLVNNVITSLFICDMFINQYIKTSWQALPLGEQIHTNLRLDDFDYYFELSISLSVCLFLSPAEHSVNSLYFILIILSIDNQYICLSFPLRGGLDT